MVVYIDNTIFVLCNHLCVCAYTYDKEEDHHVLTGLLIMVAHPTLVSYFSKEEAMLRL